MKNYKLLVWSLIGLFFIAGCGKPNDPESLTKNNDTSGGYKIVKKMATSGYAQDLVKNENLIYISQGEGGLIIIDVADPENPHVISTTTQGVRGYSTKIAMKDSVVYLAAGSFGITVVNVADPAAPEVTVSNLSMKPAKNIHIMGQYLFTAVSEQGVNIADIGYPTQPEIRGGLYTSGYAMGLTTTSDSAYLLVASGEMGLSMYDISDFQQGYGIYHIVGWCDTPGYAEDVIINEDESIAFLACGTAGLQIVNYADTNDIHIVGSIDAGGYAKELNIKDQRIYMTTELSGLQIIDVSDAYNPKLVGIVETQYALGVELGEDYIYVTDEDEGLIIISYPN
ncbi:MAG: hypothetical protein K9G76_02870 [Bacteroidales bacterium]|nr:hypothetical protein [Bacteroidales bacterium]MCF8402736.1 hypothetical protein [Bacteroidales bacterium]